MDISLRSPIFLRKSYRECGPISLVGVLSEAAILILSVPVIVNNLTVHL